MKIPKKVGYMKHNEVTLSIPIPQTVNLKSLIINLPIPVFYEPKISLQDTMIISQLQEIGKIIKCNDNYQDCTVVLNHKLCNDDYRCGVFIASLQSNPHWFSFTPIFIPVEEKEGEHKLLYVIISPI